MPIETQNIDVINKRLAITLADHDLADQAVRAALRDLIEEVGVECLDIMPPPKKFYQSHWFLGVVGTAIGLLLLVLSLAGGGLPLAALIALGATCAILTVILGASSYYHAWLKLYKSRTLTMDTLFAISTIIVLAVSIAAFFVPWLPMMFEAGLLIFGFRHIGLAIEESIKQKMALDKTFQNRLPSEVTIWLSDEQHETRELASVLIDEILWIKPGEIIPLDGLALYEDTLIDDSIITGAIKPRVFKRGQCLLSGMRLAPGADPLKFQVTASIKDSYLARLDRNIERANHEKAPIEEAANKILQYFIPTVILLAIVTATVIGLFFPPALAIQCAVTILVSACPCTLGLIVPLAVKIGMQKGAEHGVQFKSGKSMQACAAIDAVVLDLNGTITTGEPSLVKVGVFDESMTEEELLIFAAAIESESTHPVGKAIYLHGAEKYAMQVNNLQVSKRDKPNHCGTGGQINSHHYCIGNEQMMAEQGIDTQHYAANIALDPGESLVYLTRDNELLGYFILSDPLRKDARRTIELLKNMGKKVYICTGADQETAYRYAKMLGIEQENVQASCVGMAEAGKHHSKAAFIKQLQQQGLKVAGVGDQGNDSLFLAQCNFGLAIKSSASDEMTQQQAGAVIQNGSLLPVASAFAIGSSAVSNIKQNLSFSLVYNMTAMVVIILLLILLGTTMNPGVGVALMIIQTSLVLLNAYRFKNKIPGFLKNTEDKEPCDETNSWLYSHSNLCDRQRISQPDTQLECEEVYHGGSLFNQDRDIQNGNPPEESPLFPVNYG